jgi:hypothetical protein
MTKKDYEDAISREVEQWPGVQVEFVTGGKHPKAKLTYTPSEEGADPLQMSRPYAGTPSDAARGVHQTLSDMRKVMKQLGATRAKPAPSQEEDEAPYRKPNEGRAKRPDPVKAGPTPEQPNVIDQLLAAGAVTQKQVDNVVITEDPSLITQLALEGDRAVVKTLESTIDESRAKARRILADKPLPASREIKDVVLAEAMARVEAIVDGVYFDLPDEIYHAVPRLSASGVQKICASPATFWRGSWLDPERPPLDEEQTLAQLLGKAYHKARLEPDLFLSTYVRKLDKTEFPDALFTADHMKAVCEDIGLSKTGTKDVLADRLVDHGYTDRPIWTVLERAWEEERGGRIPLDAKHFDQMATDMGRIRQNGEVAALLVDGFAEVSIFYTDQYGIKMKSRVDYLALTHWADFKTFENSRQKELDTALADAMRYNRYYIQAAVYREAVEAVRVGGLDVIGNATDAQREFITKLRLSQSELECHYVFQEKGGVPNLLAYEYPFYMVPYSTIFHEAITEDAERKEAMRELTRNRTRLFMKAQHDVIEAKKLFVLYSQVYPAGTPWFPLKARRTFNDEMFSAFWLETFS